MNEIHRPEVIESWSGCRLCLQRISHEPIKINRSMQDFLSKKLFLANICRIQHDIMEQCVLCAKCFNHLSDLQEFYDHCIEMDKYWQDIFDGAAGAGGAELGMMTASEKDGEESPQVEMHHQEDGRLELVEYEVIDEMLEKDLTMYQEERGEVGTSSEVSSSEKFLEVYDGEEDAVATSGSSVELSRIIYYEPNTATAIMEMVDVEDEMEMIVQLGESSSNNTQVLLMNEKTENTLLNNEEDILLANHEQNDHEEVEMSSSLSAIAVANKEDLKKTPETVVVASNNELIQDHRKNRNNLRYRILYNHEDNRRHYQCLACEKQFERLSDMETHANIHENRKPFVCQICGRGFRQKNILNTHQIAIHFGKKIECPDCGKKFSRSSQLILHNRMHRDEKPFQCDFENCSAAFRQRQHLLDHKNIHTGARSFCCRFCGKSFHMRRRLQDHLYKVHNSHCYRCHICSKGFLKPHMLKNHLASVHELEMTDVSHLRTTLDS